MLVLMLFYNIIWLSLGTEAMFFHKESLTLISSGLLHLDLALQEKTIPIRTEMKKEIIKIIK